MQDEKPDIACCPNEEGVDIVLEGGARNVGVVIEEAEGTLDDVDGFGSKVGD